MSKLLLRASFIEKDIYSGLYRAELASYRGVDFSQKCFVFPGQNSAFPGMFKEELNRLASFRHRFDQADEIALSLGLPKISLFLSAPEKLTKDELQRSRNPALFVTEVALFESIVSLGIQPRIITAHSFGEFAGYVASGIARFEDILKIVIERDRLSPEPRSLGSMIAVQAPRERIAAVLAPGRYFFSNFNSPNQSVISTSQEHLQATMEQLKQSRLAALLLHEVPQPYHSPMMRRVSVELKPIVFAYLPRFTAPKYPLFSSVSGELIEAAGFDAEAAAQNLAEQVLTPVDFRHQIESVRRRHSIHNFLELGPNQFCSRFIADTLANSTYKLSKLERILNGPNSLKANGQTTRVTGEKKGLFGLLNKAISSVTGYSIDQISVDDKFQEDLGIDSIKKAEIVFKFAESVAEGEDGGVRDGLNLSQIVKLSDVITYFDAKTKSGKPGDKLPVPPNFRRFVESWQASPLTDIERLNLQDLTLGKPLALDLSEPPHSDEDVAVITAKLRTSANESCVILFARKVTGAEADLDLRDPQAPYLTRLLPWLKVFHSLSLTGEKWNRRLALVLEDGCHPFLKGLDGFFKSLFREEVICCYKHIEFDRLDSGTGFLRLVDEEFADHASTDIRFEKGERLTKQWLERSIAAQRTGSQSPLPIKPVVLSIGGTRGVLSAVLEGLVASRPHAAVSILGRRPENDVRPALERLRKTGAHISYFQADAGDRDALEHAIADILAKNGRIDIILNGAGQEVSRSLSGKKIDELQGEFLSKAAPACHLHELSKQNKIARIFNFSSIAAEFGNPGQSIYALGNQAMCAVHEHVSPSATAPAVVNLILPPWENLGMTENFVIANSLKARGIPLLPKDQGVAMIVAELASGLMQGAVGFFDANDVRYYDKDLTNPRAYAGLLEEAPATGKRIPISGLAGENAAYLNEHVINGRIIYPGSAALALFLHVGTLYFKRPPILANFEAKSFLTVDPKKPSHYIELQKIDANRIKARICSEVVHFETEMYLDPAKWPEIAVQPFEGEQEIDIDVLLANKRIALGKIFHVLHECWSDRDKEIAGVQTLAKLPRYTSITAYDRLQQWLECGLQVAGTKYLWELGEFGVPQRIHRLVPSFQRRLTGQLYYRAYGIGASVAASNIHMLNEFGEVIMEFQGVEMVSIGGDDRPDRFQFKKESGTKPVLGASV